MNSEPIFHEPAQGGADTAAVPTKPPDRLLYVDLLRPIAMLGVIAIHVSAGPLMDAKTPNPVWWASVFYNSLARIGVPTYGFSPLKLSAEDSLLELMHGDDERVSVEALRFGLPVLWEAVIRFCG